MPKNEKEYVFCAEAYSFCVAKIFFPLHSPDSRDSTAGRKPDRRTDSQQLELPHLRPGRQHFISADFRQYRCREPDPQGCPRPFYASGRNSVSSILDRRKRLLARITGIADRRFGIFFFRIACSIIYRKSDSGNIAKEGEHPRRRHIIQNPSNGVTMTEPSLWRTQHRFTAGTNGRPSKRPLRNSCTMSSVSMVQVKPCIAGAAPL